MRKIASFRGRYSFLSNFYSCPITVRAFNLEARTAEHAFQSLKTRSREEAVWVLEAPTPAAAKRRGKKVTLRPDWDAVRLEAMEEVLRLKFAPGSPMAAKLVGTGDRELVEGNTWGDRFWGVSKGTGQNHLGRLLMKIRNDLGEG